MTAEDSDKSVSDGGRSDEQHPAGAPSRTSTPDKVLHASKKRKTMTKTREMTAEGSDNSVSDGSPLSDEQHPAGTPSHTSTTPNLVSRAKVSL